MTEHATSARHITHDAETRRARDAESATQMRDGRAIQKICARRARDTEYTCTTSARHRTCNVEHMTQMRDERVTQNTRHGCVTNARYRTHVRDERATQNTQHRIHNMDARQARNTEHMTRIRRASDTEYATRMRVIHVKKSEARRRLRHASLIRRLEVDI